MIKKNSHNTLLVRVLDPYITLKKQKKKTFRIKQQKLIGNLVYPFARSGKGFLTQIKLVCRHYVDFIPVDENFICLINC